MAILIDETKRVLVQGITGREGQARTRLMRQYGTNVVAGVTPGKGGQTVFGVPVFNTPQDAVNSLGKIDISVLFVPAAGVKDAAISAIEAGIKLTESFAMHPGASVSGLYFSHPEAKYFGVGKIGRDQVKDYASRLGEAVAAIEKRLATNLGYEPGK